MDKFIDLKSRQILEKLPKGDRPPESWWASKNWLKALPDMVSWAFYFTDGNTYYVLREGEFSPYFGSLAVGEVEEEAEAVAA